MRTDEFLKVMEADLVTHKDKEQLTAVLEVMKDVLKGSSADIDPKKTVEECFKHMREHARKNQKNGCYYMGPTESRKIVAEYLGLSEIGTSNENHDTGSVNLEDFI